jgi:hypothetical protein
MRRWAPAWDRFAILQARPNSTLQYFGS